MGERQDFDLAMTHEMEMEVQGVCNLSKGIWEPEADRPKYKELLQKQ